HTRFSRDWSSDVCSSDLLSNVGRDAERAPNLCDLPPESRFVSMMCAISRGLVCDFPESPNGLLANGADAACCPVRPTVGKRKTRSEERRVGKEGGAWGSL